MDPRPFKFLVKLVVRAFYAGPCPPKDYQGDKEEGGTKTSKLDKLETKGLAMILMDYLLDQEWVSEDQLLADLQLHHKLVRRALKFLQEEHLLMSEHRRETKRMRAGGKDAVVNVMSIKAQEQQALQELRDGAVKQEEEADPDEIMEVQKQHTFSYWAVDLPRAFDMIQLRLHVMRQLLKDELDAKEEVGRYVCKAPHCIKQYDSFDIPDILQFDGSLQCAMCGGVVEQVFATGQTGDDDQRKMRRERCSRVQHDMETQLESMLKLCSTLRHVQPPFLGSLHDWALNRARAAEAAKAEAEGRGLDAQRTKGGGVVTLAPPSAPNREQEAYRETHVQVTLADGSGEAQTQPQQRPKAPKSSQPSGAARIGAPAAAAANAPAAGAAADDKAAVAAAVAASATEGAEQKPAGPSSAQPFFLRSSTEEAAPHAANPAHAVASIAGVAPDLDDGLEWMDDSQGLQGAGESKEEMDAYTARMLASFGAAQPPTEHSPAEHVDWEQLGAQPPKLEEWQEGDGEERAGKRARLDDGSFDLFVGQPMPKAEDGQAAQAASGAGAQPAEDDAEWEDI